MQRYVYWFHISPFILGPYPFGTMVILYVCHGHRHPKSGYRSGFGSLGIRSADRLPFSYGSASRLRLGTRVRCIRLNHNLPRKYERSSRNEIRWSPKQKLDGVRRVMITESYARGFLREISHSHRLELLRVAGLNANIMCSLVYKPRKIRRPVFGWWNEGGG